MKILITTDLFTSETNGVVTSVKNLQSELETKGHDVRILTLSDSVRSHREGTVYYIRSMPIGVYPNIRMPLSYRHRLIQELIDWKPDVIHSQCEFFSFQYARRISKITGAPLVHTYHTLYEQYFTYLFPSERVGKFVVRVASQKRLKHVDRLIAPSYKVEDTLRGYGIDNAISVVPSGIDLEQHQNRLSEEERKAKRMALGIGDEQLVLLNLGRLGTEKNLEELMRLFSYVLVDHDNMVFLIVGDGPAREELEHQAQSLGIADHVIFTGMVGPSEVQDYYQLGDVFVSASTSETQGLTYVEAAANGLPLLCRQDRCLQNVIRQGENGYEYTCVEDFCAALEELASDPIQRKNAGQRSVEIATAFDKCAFGNSVESVYKSVLQ